MENKPSQAPHRSTMRTLAVLDALAHSPHGMTMAELARVLDVPKSSLFPILHTMADLDYVAHDEGTGRYAIGFRTYLLGRAFDSEQVGLPVIEAEMRRVVAECDETCQLGVLDHGRVLYVAKVESTQQVRLSSEIGKTLPAHCTAIGKAILSQMSDDEVRALLPERLEQPTPRAVSDVEQLVVELREVRETGFAHDRQEVLEGVECMAVPVRWGQSTQYGLSVSVPAYRLSDACRKRVELCLSEARDRIEHALG